MGLDVIFIQLYQTLAPAIMLGSCSPVEPRRASGSISDTSSLEAAEDDEKPEIALLEAMKMSVPPILTEGVIYLFIYFLYSIRNHPSGRSNPFPSNTLIFRLIP